ncbi:MAG: hypothetical protein RLZZ543_2133 [Bacteroidota bacterium]
MRILNSVYMIVRSNYKLLNMILNLRITLLASFLFVSAMTYGQTSNSSLDTLKKTPTKEKKNGFRKQRRGLSIAQINQLKDGALLVRLHTKKNSIAALRKIGKDKLADEMEARQRNYNLQIVSAFKRNFNFCPTYFFFSDYSQSIRERRFDKVIFLSDSLVPDTTIRFNKANFLTAEFGNIEQDTAKHISYYSHEPNGNLSSKRSENYYGGPNIGFGALVIKSDQLIHLRRPFPYYIRTFDSLPIRRSSSKTVKKMNKKLFKFYDKGNK